MITDELIGVREAARRLGVHENTVRNMAADGRLGVAARLPRTGYARYDAGEVEQLRRTMDRERAGAQDSDLPGLIPIRDPWVTGLARTIQDTMSRIAPSFGITSPTWDELDRTTEGRWARWLAETVISEMLRRGVLVAVSRDQIAHLADDWDAQAAQIERGDFIGPELLAEARIRRECAGLLRDLTGIPQDRTR